MKSGAEIFFGVKVLTGDFWFIKAEASIYGLISNEISEPLTLNLG